VKDIELIGPRVRVRRARPADASASFDWFANPVVTEYLPLAGESSLPMENIVSFLEQASRDDDPDFSVGLELLTGELFGCGGLRAIVPGTSAEVSVVVGEQRLWGHGYGGEALQLLLDFAFQELRMGTVWLIVRADNTRGVRLFTRLGFVVVETFDALVGVSATPRQKHRMELQSTRWAERRR
jgi:RimJ/RimL family protein N-acetyltransferase